MHELVMDIQYLRCPNFFLLQNETHWYTLVLEFYLLYTYLIEKNVNFYYYAELVFIFLL